MRALLPLILLAGAGMGSSAWVEPGGRPQYFAVSVQDIDRSVAWYTSAFGLKQLDDERAADGAWRIVNLASESLAIELIWDRRDQTVQGARGIAKVGFGVASLEQAAARIEQATGKRPRIVEIPKRRIRVLQLVDPDGNIIQLQSPAA